MNLRVIVVDGFFAAVVVFVLAIAAYVVGSFALMRAHTERRPLLATLRAMMREVFWLVITQPVAPLWYVVGSRMGRGRGTVPVVFVHGYMQNRIDFIWLTSRLRHARVGTMYGFNYPWMTTVAGNAARLARFVERVCREENAERADVVCHSMGGLVALEYMRHDAHRVRRCVTIAAPHSGVTWRGPMLGFGATDLRRASKFLATLSAIALPVPTLSIFSTHDNVVHPPQTSALAHRGGEDAPLDEGLGHFSMLFSPDVASRVEHFLEKEEPAAAAGGAAPRVQELAIEPLRSS